jgi:hypothetical protein
MIVVALVAGAGIAASVARAQVEISVDPTMVRGASGAPVTIVEFSDYQ